MITNKMKIVQLKMREARFWPKIKFEPILFQVLWQFLSPNRPKGSERTCQRLLPHPPPLASAHLSAFGGVIAVFVSIPFEYFQTDSA
jgi:hypothetical protein